MSHQNIKFVPKYHTDTRTGAKRFIGNTRESNSAARKIIILK